MEKIDFSKFDATKLFNVDSALTKLEESTNTATSLITDKKSRDLAETLSKASFEFVRTQNAAAVAYSEALKKALAI